MRRCSLDCRCRYCVTVGDPDAPFHHLVITIDLITYRPPQWSGAAVPYEGLEQYRGMKAL